jgi:hypothetical protein
MRSIFLLLLMGWRPWSGDGIGNKKCFQTTFSGRFCCTVCSAGAFTPLSAKRFRPRRLRRVEADADVRFSTLRTTARENES